MSNQPKPVKRYEAFWVRGAGWTFSASEPDTEDSEVELELISAADYDRDIKALRDVLRPFVEKVPHEKDHGRPGNPVGWCERCRLDAALKEARDER